MLILSSVCIKFALGLCIVDRRESLQLYSDSFLLTFSMTCLRHILLLVRWLKILSPDVIWCHPHLTRFLLPDLSIIQGWCSFWINLSRHFFSSQDANWVAFGVHHRCHSAPFDICPVKIGFSLLYLRDWIVNYQLRLILNFDDDRCGKWTDYNSLFIDLDLLLLFLIAVDFLGSFLDGCIV
jgi:hypothetical protein